MARKATAPAKPRKGSYWAASRSLAASYVFVTPLFAVYQVGLFFDEGVRNGLGPILEDLFQRFSHLGLVVLNVFVLGLLLLAIYRSRSRLGDRRGLYGAMFAEAVAWTVVMLLFARFVVPPILERALALAPQLQRPIAYIGAGIYEEVFFRFFVLGGLVLVLHRGLGGQRIWVVPVAIVGSALLFSWAHHSIGGQTFTWEVFVYRALMGVVLGCIYIERGLGIVVYSHALYNVALLYVDP